MNSFEFKVYGRLALFTDPITKVGGECMSYPVPTYEAIKGILRSIAWKPTYVWVPDSIRVMKQILTRMVGVTPRIYPHGEGKAKYNLSMYTYLADVEYQVRAHFEWAQFQKDLEQDRNENKHSAIIQRAIDRGGRRDIFLGRRDCQAYVEPVVFGEGQGYYDTTEEFAFGMMFHSFGYPNETGNNMLVTRFWKPVMRKGIIEFIQPDDCPTVKVVRNNVQPQYFGREQVCPVESEEEKETV